MPIGEERATASELELVDAYWRAANYLSVGQIYLLDNPLLREPLLPEHVKPRLLGHFGTTPGLNFVYAHLNRAITARDLSMIYVTGPGHGGPGLVANAYLEGTYGERYPQIDDSEDGLRALFRQFSFPGGIPSTSHRDARLDPRRRRAGVCPVACVRGGVRQPRPDRRVRRRRRRSRDRAARDELALEQVPEPGRRRRRVADPAPERLQDRQPDGAGPHPRARAHVALRGVRLAATARRGRARGGARRGASPVRRDARRGARRDPCDPGVRADGGQDREAALADADPALAQGLDGTAEVDGLQVEGTWRSHQVPVGSAREDDGHRAILETWLRSYRPTSCSTTTDGSCPSCERSRRAASGG